MAQTFTVPTTDDYTSSKTGRIHRFHSGDVIATALAVEFGMAGATLDVPGSPFGTAEEARIDTLSAQDVDVPASVNGLRTVVARTATADGTGTGTIADGTDVVIVTSANANHILVLPTPTPGQMVVLVNGATGYELRTSDPATIALNNGTGASAESAIPANTTIVAFCRTATSWTSTNTAADGTSTPTETAAA